MLRSTEGFSERCENCAHFWSNSTYQYCKRYPPALTGNGSSSAWPATLPNMRCGEWKALVEEVPAPEPCGCLDKVKITDRIMNRIEREQMWEKQHADNYVYLQAGVCRENARTLTKLLQEINEGDFDHTSCKPEPVLTRPALDKEDVLNRLEKAQQCGHMASILFERSDNAAATFRTHLSEIVKAIRDGDLDMRANR